MGVLDTWTDGEGAKSTRRGGKVEGNSRRVGGDEDVAAAADKRSPREMSRNLHISPPPST